MPNDVNINLRAESRVRSLIDEAAKALNVSRTEFMISAAVRDAQDTLLDRSKVVLDANSFAELMDQLDRGQVGDLDRARELLDRKKAWD
jgi:uncharacterized protein (DUF1778 family)